MKTFKLTPMAAVAALSLGASGSALADVLVDAEIDKDKQVSVDITVEKTKDVNIDVTFDEELINAAEAMAFTNQKSDGGVVDRSQQEGVDPEMLNFMINLEADITDSINANTGFLGFNQDVGNMVNQGNTLAVASVEASDPATGGAMTHAEATAEQETLNGSVTHEGMLVDLTPGNPNDKAFDPNREATIANAVGNNSGIIGVNQNTGNMTNQTNTIANSVGLDAALAISEADLGQRTVGHTVDEVETVKVATIADAVNGNTGIIAGNQNNGNFSNQGNVIAFSALTSTASIGVPGS
ncbi:hypothetical protein CCR85_10875 [Rhodothalassium salexigens]|uniref:hypothetical protein n=1 Tax=Rhodothalassium salexigens TaxID=1086 RepID=UPI001912876C|nr:hypothetical protein [Rhodothalassium salexigens]MBK5911992.1 hypothetical protein [Rhodothalassium salexigens]MBK5922156.1 hypothetical protein [Rhodothalassium salexigens]